MKNYTAPPVPNVPNDFFQSPSTSTSSIKTNASKIIEEKVEKVEEKLENLDKGELPKGFFDDPMLDAKVSFVFVKYYGINVINCKCFIRLEKRNMLIHLKKNFKSM